MPFLPTDFDYRFFQSAPDGMTISYPQGGEFVELVNLTRDGLMRFEMKVPRVFFLVRHDYGRSEATPVADTVLIEPLDGRCEVTLRATIPCDGNSLRLREVIVLHPNESVKRAFLQGKRLLQRSSRPQ